MAYILKCSKHGVVCCTKCLYSKAKKKKEEEERLDTVDYIGKGWSKMKGNKNDPV